MSVPRVLEATGDVDPRYLLDQIANANIILTTVCKKFASH
jgi:hypothetical protein